MDKYQFLEIRASAGSGKTFSLAVRYLYLLSCGANPSEILTLTFTNKAAGEMSGRIRHFLDLLALDVENSESQSIKDALIELGVNLDRVDFKEILERFLASNTRITTIDSFLNSIMKKFCWYAGVSSNFKISNISDDEIYNEFLNLLESSPEIKEFFLQKCRDEDIRVVDALSKFVAINSNYFDCLPDDEDFADEVDYEREILLNALNIKNVVIGNPNSSASAKKAVDFEDLNGFFDKSKSWMESRGEYSYFKKLQLDESLFDDLHKSVFLYCKQREKKFLSKLGSLCAILQKAKDNIIYKISTLHFDDVTNKTYRLLCEDNHDRDFFYFRLDDKISHMLLDEFQDTSIIQYKILLPLIEEIISGSGRIDSRSLFVVGDTKQSIYGFRGGYSGLLDFVGDSLGMEKKSLDTNYRSLGNLVGFVNDVFRDKIVGYEDQKCKKGDGGYVEIVDIDNFKENEEEALQSVWNIIDRLLENNIPQSDIAILVFKNKDAIRLVEYLRAKSEDLEILVEDSFKLSFRSESKIVINSILYHLKAQDPKEQGLCKKNILKLQGKGYDENIEIPELCGSVAEYTYEVMKFFNISTHISQKLLEVACDYDDYEEFIEALDSIDVGASEDREGIRLLTIHGSKGLEFEHLIVFDRASPPKGRYSMVVCDYGKNPLENRMYLYSNSKYASLRKIVDPNYAEVLDRSKALDDREKQNLLYVALTRAKKSLFVVINSANGAFGVLKDYIDSHDTKVIGDFPHQSTKSNTLKVQNSSTLVSLEKFGKQDNFVKKDKYLANDFSAMNEGEIIHTLFEYSLGHHISDETQLKEFIYNKYGFFVSTDRLNEIFEIFLRCRLEVLDKFRGFSNIATEVSFIEENKLYRIDSLIFFKDADGKDTKIVILDYKSGAVNDEGYTQQIKRYYEYVSSKFENLSVEAYLFYVNGGFRKIF